MEFKNLKEIDVILNKINYCIPYDYYNRHHGYVTKIMGDESYGSITNRYIYSNLIGGENTSDGIKFNDNPYFKIRIDDNDILLKQKFLQNIASNYELYYGLKVEGFTIKDVNVEKNTYRTLKQSPILISKKYKKDYLTEEDLFDTEKYLIDSIMRKSETVGFDIDPNFSLKIKRMHNHKDILYNGIINKGRVFELEIKSNQETKNFILLNGIGRSCGTGFGFIY